MIVIADPSAARRQQLADLLPGEDIVEVADLDAVGRALARGLGDGPVAVLGPGLDHTDALAVAERIARSRNGTATLLVAERFETALLRDALHAGVDDVLTLASTRDDWATAIADCRARHLGVPGAAADDDDAPGRVVSVFSTKGGCGRSLVASNLAVLIAGRIDAEVALVDLDLQSGDLAIMLQLTPVRSIFDAAADAGRLDVDAMAGYLTAHRSGVKLLAAPLEPSLGEQVDPGAVRSIIDLLTTMYPLTIVDGPPLFTDQLLAAFDVTDLFVLVGSMDVPSIKNLKLAIATLAQLGHPRERLRIVLNRADSKVGLRPGEVEEALGARIDVLIPSSRDVPLSVNQGTPLALSRPRSAVVQAIAELIPAVLPRAAPPTRTRSFRRR